MVNSIFKRTIYDDIATRNNVLQAFGYYRDLLEERAQLNSISLSAQSYDGMPLSDTNVNGQEEAMFERLKLQEKNDWEISLFKNAIKSMSSLDEESDKMATILELHFMENYDVETCCYKYGLKYNEINFARSTFFKYQKQGLLKFAGFYPRELRVKKM